MALGNFTPGTYGQTIVAPYVSSRIAIPGGDGLTLMITNLGPGVAVVSVGDVTVEVTEATGVIIPPMGSVPLAIGEGAYLAAMGLGSSAKLCLSQGT